MPQVFAPGCALMMYKPNLVRRITALLNSVDDVVPEHHICCRHEPRLAPGTKVINVCAGCDRRFRTLYEGVSTASLWEVLAQSSDFPFPDYHRQKMAIHDACPTRTEERVHNAVRILLTRMNITVIEPMYTRKKAICCGDSFFAALPADEIKEQMINRASQMPVQDVVVYCVSCVKSMHIGGKTPRHLVDLLFNEPTDAGIFEPDDWHSELQAYINAH